MPIALTLPHGPGPINGRAPIYAASLLADGELQLESSATRVAWVVGTAAPGEAHGVLAIAGHVDTRADGRALFYNLRSIRTGAKITVDTYGGQKYTYTVTRHDRYTKADLSQEGVFDKTGPHRLALITCDGPYDHKAGAYPDNLVIWAEPAAQ